MRETSDTRAAAATKAQAMWATFTANEKGMVRFGMFPAGKMNEAEKDAAFSGKELAVALMDCATKDGGMRA